MKKLVATIFELIVFIGIVVVYIDYTENEMKELGSIKIAGQRIGLEKNSKGDFAIKGKILGNDATIKVDSNLINEAIDFVGDSVNTITSKKEKENQERIERQRNIDAKTKENIDKMLKDKQTKYESEQKLKLIEYEESQRMEEETLRLKEDLKSKYEISISGYYIMSEPFLKTHPKAFQISVDESTIYFSHDYDMPQGKIGRAHV